MPEVVAKLHAAGQPVDVIHLAGSRDREQVVEAYAKTNAHAEVHGFHQDMAGVYRRADFAISRSGANSCLELALFGIPALLIPYPFSARNHQVANANAMVAAHAADMLEQKDITADKLAAHLGKRLADSASLSAMRQAAHTRVIPGADEKLADLVEEVTRPR